MRHIVLFLFVVFFQAAQAHYTARYHVIVDTDGDMADLRAIALLMASPEVEVIAITTSGGRNYPDSACCVVKQLLGLFHHRGIPCGAGYVLPTLSADAMYSTQFAFKHTGLSCEADAQTVLANALAREDKPVTIIALGPLTNISALYSQGADSLTDRIARVVWYDAVRGNAKHYNLKVDPPAALILRDAGVAVEQVCMNEEVFPSADVWATLNGHRSEYARFSASMYASQPSVRERASGRPLVGEELAALFLLRPDVFVKGKKDAWHLTSAAAFWSLCMEVFESDTEDKSVVFEQFPTDSSQFAADVRSLVSPIIARHGLREWKLVVLTNEFHEHLGIYSIVGAKMGLAAREYFRVGIDELEVVSYAGSNPPLSCLNDGLQVSTGATLGHGTIRFAPTDKPEPRADFVFKGRTLRMSLKADYMSAVRSEISSTTATCELNTPAYWEAVRQQALKIWLEWSRHEIFEMEEL